VADPQTGKLPVRTKLLYGVGDSGNAVVNSAVQFFPLIFYTDAALLSPALVGSALFVGKLWDAINDPIAGWLTDRMASPRFGKRRVFMIFGAVPLAISIMLLWFVPQGLSPAAVFAWIVLTFNLCDSVTSGKIASSIVLST
jgi:GPH family glycoside/pentoside/hexuronide:cation symporter